MSAAPRSHWVMALLALAALALFVLLCSLGWWQVERRAWKLSLIERIEQRVHATPLELPAPADWPNITAASHEYMPVFAQGQWLTDKTVFTQATTILGAGFWLLTPLQLDNGAQVWVNRGFMSQAQRAAWQEPAAAEDRVTVQGLIRMTEVGGGFLRENAPAENRWHSRDVAAMAQAQGLSQAAPFFVDAGIPDAHAPAAAPDAPVAEYKGPWPRAGMTVVHFNNNHAVYAVTWFGLALMVLAAAVYTVQSTRRAKLRAAVGHDESP